ncbi:UV DNA damage repair endonuclease UvsE [Paenibacillus sp. F411]|uniref:UV-endonuclease UvdE n=1 Tax=Paenibacillus algicola TaxID=2565926 RepID=A0A4P8XGK3_9BACL|nr:MULTISPECIES: UV DNA damage repair endonuclease UvsE [Paenibacillus]MBO2945284.1 UV DNA damage repair endonuclease UvsE [Paenibacillus sp. F411]QCT01368.1 UV-endonuclease UvdE [Paenibacillus algicola]
MIVRFGYVAMSTVVQNSSPSRTMTMASFKKLDDREAGLRRLERIAGENLHNTLRLLKHNLAHDIKVYRMTSKLIPLATHGDLDDWDPFPALRESFAEVGDFVRKHEMRVSFHPDHFTVLSTPRPEVLVNSIKDLRHHTDMLHALGFSGRMKNNIHIGGAYGDKPSAAARFIEHFEGLDQDIKERLTLENDDKTFNAVETLTVCQKLGLPMVLDLHHQWVNHEGERPGELWRDVLETWNSPLAQAGSEGDNPLPPKIHVSSPKSPTDIRSHADGVEMPPLLHFLREIAAITPQLDVMIEAKKKDEALFGLMRDFAAAEGDGVKLLNQAAIEVTP